MAKEKEKCEVIEKLSAIFQEILFDAPKPGDELAKSEILYRKIDKFVLPAKKKAVAEYQYQRELDYHAMR